jgi:glycosyltransferase involved in cell wall biosynthesis
MSHAQISCIVPVKNRTDRIKPCLESWYEAEEIREVVVVDWGSDVPIVEDEYVRRNLGKKLKVIRVEGEQYFDRCKALNLAYRYTDSNNMLLLRIDVDYVLKDKSWLQHVQYNATGMLANHFIATISAATPYLAGLILVNKCDFEPGYNENLLAMWGHEDTDLIRRIEESGVRMQAFTSATDYIFHVPHGDEMRLRHADVNELGKHVSAEDLKTDKWKDVAMALNKTIAKESPVWSDAQYIIIEQKPYYTQVQRVAPSAAGAEAQPKAVISACDRSQSDVHGELPCDECQ